MVESMLQQATVPNPYMPSSQSIQSPTNASRSYQQRQTGMFGLKPYSSDKASAPMAKPKRNQLNVQIQSQRILRDL